MRILFFIVLFIVNGCSVYNAANSCGSEYQRYKDWKEHLDKATENYNVSINTGNLTSEEREELEVDLIELQINVNEALLNFEDCKVNHLKGNKFPTPHSF